jgi:hypothetical protein
MPRGRIKASPLVVGTLAPMVRSDSSIHTYQQADLDRQSISRTLDAYILAWFSGDAAAMEQCLHPDLTAHVLQLEGDSQAARSIQTLARNQGIQATLGACTHPMERNSDVSILDITGHSASARAIIGDWVAHVHLSFTGEQWAIVNILWEWLSPKVRRSA